MSDSNLSMEKMMELAMGLSMSSLICNVMSDSMANASPNMQNKDLNTPLKYIFAIIDGVQKGPLSLGETISHIKNGNITQDTFIWKQGMGDWLPAKDVDDISPNFVVAPPTPPQIK